MLPMLIGPTTTRGVGYNSSTEFNRDDDVNGTWSRRSSTDSTDFAVQILADVFINDLTEGRSAV